MILDVAISRKLLNDDEFVVVSTRTHVKAMLVPALVLIVIAGGAGFLMTLPSGSAREFLVLVISAVALLLILWVVLKPFLGWLTTTYTVTNRRLITRTGILTRRGHDIPLARISDVAYEHGLLDRMLGCGTLIVSDASEQGRVKLHDIPQVEQVHLRISDLLHNPDAARSDDGT
jgi:uncharacterized membrane protein YdbT with pleckstrin-like domain